MPYREHTTYIMKNPLNPFDNGSIKKIKEENEILIDGLKSISQSFFVWRFIFYYFIFQKNHKNIYNNID